MGGGGREGQRGIMLKMMMKVRRWMERRSESVVKIE